MQYRIDRRTGNRISALGLGCMRFPGYELGRPSVRAAEAIIARALERGINYLDTAYLYPGNEACVGEVLERLHARDRVFVATKLPHASCRRSEDFDRFFDEQLARLKTDHVDYYLMHNVTAPAQWERLVGLGVEEWVARQKAAGRIGEVGFSFHGSAGDFPVLLDAYDWDFCQIQYNYANERYQAGTAGLKTAAARGLAVFVMEPLLGGRLAGRLPDRAKRVLEQASGKSSSAGSSAEVPDRGTAPRRCSASTDARVEGSVFHRSASADMFAETDASRRSMSTDTRTEGNALQPRLETPADWGLAWVWNHPEVTMLLSGMGSPEEVDANAGLAESALPGSLSEGQLSTIRDVVRIFEAANRVPCTGCNYCMPCPHGINIPGCFSAYNASFAHGWFTGMQQYFTASAIRSDAPKLVSNCVRCGKCARHCPQHIDIPARLDDVRHRFQPGPVDWALRAMSGKRVSR